MQDTQARSLKMANAVISGFEEHNVQMITGPHRSAGFAVLKSPDTPSILLETGFLSNEQQAKELLQAAYQSRIVEGIIYALNRYFDYE
jgi:N-acetylmuramoyl-L-alanine amidase